jgi:hypothetical protein
MHDDGMMMWIERGRRICGKMQRETEEPFSLWKEIERLEGELDKSYKPFSNFEFHTQPILSELPQDFTLSNIRDAALHEKSPSTKDDELCGCGRRRPVSMLGKAACRIICRLSQHYFIVSSNQKDFYFN